MCSITGSFNKNKLKELYSLNSYRGELSYSLSVFRPVKESVSFQVLFQEAGKMPDSLIQEAPSNVGDYLISHAQAPTTSSKNIHPAVFGDAMLWHNGIVKQKSLTPNTWDTLWLLDQVLNYGWSALSNVDGTFACVMYWGDNLYVFRNEISPLYVDTELSISSTKFEGSVSLKPNTVWRIDLNKKELQPVAYFTTFENPYYFPEEL